MIEISRFLASHPPFSGLDEDQLATIAATPTVEFFPAGAEVLTEGGRPAEFLYMVRKGLVELRSGGVAVDVLGEGEVFGFPSLLSGEPPLFSVVVTEDALCYLFGAKVATEVFAAPSGMRFLTVTLQHRHTESERAGIAALRGDRVHALARGPLIVVEPTMGIVEVARTMTEAGVTAVVTHTEHGWGIVTDRDMRARAVAAGIDGSRSILDICTVPVRTIEWDALAEEAMYSMLDLGVHHLPVTEGDRLVAMLTDLDLLGLERRAAFRLRSEIQRASDPVAVGALGRRIPEVAASVTRAGANADHVARVMAVLTDALVVRLIGLAETELGSAPCRFAWLALGSSGRREQGLRTDQDHTLVYEDEEADEYFRAVAERVVSGLEAAGLPRCESKVMASERGWRGPLAWWLERLDDWTMEPDRKAAFLTGIAFDYRKVTGELDVTPIFDHAIAATRDNQPFLRRLGRLAIELSIPIGFLGNLVTRESNEQAEVLDIKQGGLLPVTEMARLFALRAGVTVPGTVARLQQAATAGGLVPEQAEGLAEAFRIFRRIRLLHQLERWESGKTVDNLVAPERLGRIERSGLRDGFRIVREVQASLRQELMPRVLGR